MSQLPVDVVVPHTLSRAWFFRQFTLPSIESQNPSRIIIMDDPGGACEKRNAGAAKASAPYIFFCDDDLIIGNNYLKSCLEMLESNSPEVGYAYSDWIQVPLPGCMDSPITQAQYVVVPEFKHLPLYDRGGVDFMVVRRYAFQPFDPKVKRYQTWDWSLSMRSAGFSGRKVPGYNIVSFMIDRGITTGTSVQDSVEARAYIQRKHGIIS